MLDRRSGGASSALTELELRERVARLAAIERSSASPGERDAAELIASELRESGARVRLESERAHGAYWWPVILMTGAAAAAGLRGRRLAATLIGALAAAGVADDVSGGSLWFRRHLLRRHDTVNVAAELGDADAPRTVVVVAHHDAAHSGLLFHPDLLRVAARRFPGMLERGDAQLPVAWPAVGGPGLVALGALLGAHRARLAGVAICVLCVAVNADVAGRAVVPGANDNLSGVAVLLSLARTLSEHPPPNVRTILLSAGSEESFMEGMQGFARRHFPALSRQSTRFICVDTVGSPRLTPLADEGMLRIHDYSPRLLELLRGCAGELGIDLHAPMRLRAATDALIALRAGYEASVLTSVDEWDVPTEYHWPTDTADRVDYGTVADAARLCDAAIRRLAVA